MELCRPAPGRWKLVSLSSRLEPLGHLEFIVSHFEASTVGGTILGTSRDKPYRMLIGGKGMDATDAILANYEKHHLEVLVCLGGDGTQKNALYLKEKVLTYSRCPS